MQPLPAETLCSLPYFPAWFKTRVPAADFYQLAMPARRSLQPKRSPNASICCGLVIVRVGRVLRHRWRRIFLQEIQHHFDGLFELRIVAAARGFGIEFDFDIGGNTVIFHVPNSVGTVKRE